MSERQEFKGNYLGFTYNGRHSSTFGIVRTSDGSRFNENLLPTMQDKTVQVPGGDGMYYFGSYYTQRQFSVSFAFDSLTDDDITELKRHFGDKKTHKLIFDETPYKVWDAKVTGTATLKYVVFEEDDGTRIYKGEGSLQFTCYNPFAQCKSINRADYAEYDNIDEWWSASRIDEGGNFGDVPVSFRKEISGDDTAANAKISFGNEEINWENLPAKVTATLDTKIGVVVAKNNQGDIKAGDILNKYVTGNLTMKIPVGATRAQTRGLEFKCLYF